VYVFDGPTGVARAAARVATMAAAVKMEEMQVEGGGTRRSG
jgi:hypothetical protein